MKILDILFDINIIDSTPPSEANINKLLTALLQKLEQLFGAAMVPNITLKGLYLSARGNTGCCRWLKSKRLSGQDQDDIMNLRSILHED